MKKNKFDIAFEIIGWIFVIISLIFITAFIFIIISLFKYDKCSQLEFEPAYCEKYKDY